MCDQQQNVCSICKKCESEFKKHVSSCPNGCLICVPCLKRRVEINAKPFCSICSYSYNLTNIGNITKQFAHTCQPVIDPPEIVFTMKDLLGVS